MVEEFVFKAEGIEIRGTKERLEELVSFISYGDNEPSSALADIVSEIECTFGMKS